MTYISHGFFSENNSPIGEILVTPLLDTSLKIFHYENNRQTIEKIIKLKIYVSNRLNDYLVTPYRR